MVHVGEATSDGSSARSGCVGGRARERVRFLRFVYIGDAMHLSAWGASPETLQREGRWTADACKRYVRSHGKDARYVTNVMALEGMGDGIQAGQGNDWGQVDPIPKLEG